MKNEKNTDSGAMSDYIASVEKELNKLEGSGLDVEALYEKVKKNCVPEWNDAEIFTSWLAEEVKASPGRKLIRFDKSKPYGPENCMLSANVPVLAAPFKEKYGVDFCRAISNIRRYYGEDFLCEEWKSTKRFYHWLQHYTGSIPYKSRLRRYDLSKPYSPENCYFARGRKPAVLKKSKESVYLRKRILEIFKETGMKFDARYASLVSRKRLDPRLWERDDFYRFIIRLYDSGKLHKGMYMHKIQRDKPFTENNVYFSLRKEGAVKYGMSYTKLMGEYNSIRSKHAKEFPNGIAFDDFAKALLDENYYPGKSVAIKTELPLGKYALSERLEILDANEYHDLQRICEAYRSIPEEENDFDGLDEFMRWSVMSGYDGTRDFKKVGPGFYSPETCVWDIFTEEGKKQHSAMISEATAPKRRMDYIYRKRANWKAVAGVSGGFEDIEFFRKWCKRHKIGPGSCVYRRDKNKPYSPDNVIIIKKSA